MERLANASSKDLGVVTPLVTAEREQASFAERFPFLRIRRPLSCQGLLGVSEFFVFILKLILFYFRFIYLY